jgi:hypothetical protein
MMNPGDLPMLVNRCNLLALSLLVVLGCGSDNTIRWTGEVTFEGTPVESGSIRFEPVGGQGQTAGAAIIQGKYSVELTPGKYNLEVRGSRRAGEEPAYAGGTEMVPIIEQLGQHRETVDVTANEQRNFSLEKH